MPQNGSLGWQLDRLERILLKCAEEDRRQRKERRSQADEFQKQLRTLREKQKKWEEEKRARPGNPDEDPKH
jgi:hypothetical protein